MVFLLGVHIASHLKVEDLKCLLQLNNGGSASPAIFTLLQTAALLTVQQVLDSFSRMLIIIPLYEFICAQSPHSMKGMLIGLIYAIQGVVDLLGRVIQIPFVWYWKYSYPSCGFVYYSMNTVIGVVSFVVLVRVANRYKYRERDEPSRERQFAEEYYSKDIQRELHYDYSISTQYDH